jgi:hypothetical protein
MSLIEFRCGVAGLAFTMIILPDETKRKFSEIDAKILVLVLCLFFCRAVFNKKSFH